MKNIVTIICILATLPMYAQDAFFSQPFANPLNINPALTGKHEGNFRLIANHRDQWPSIPKAYVTSAASIDLPILKKLIKEGDVLGFGVSGISDVTSAGAFKYTYLSASLSYHKILDENGYYSVGAGFQGTYSNTMLNRANLRFEDELTSGGFVQNSSNEYLGSTPITGTAKYTDFNAGVLFNGTTNGANQFQLGFALYHLNEPDMNLRSDQTIYTPWKVAKKSVIHGRANIALGERIGMDVGFVRTAQYKSINTMFGGNIAIRAGENIDNPTNLLLGGWVRMNDAYVPNLGLEFKGIRIMASMDINVTDVKTATAGNGGYEFSLCYMLRKPSENDFSRMNMMY